MPVPATSVSWLGSLVWLLALTAVAFLVSWLAAGLLRMPRTPYIGVLTIATAAMSIGYLQWLGVGFVDVLTARWTWGLVAAPVVAVFLVAGMLKLPVVGRPTGARLCAALAWEAVVYGITEGVLLSALPVFMTWQLVRSLGWSGAGGGLARWTLPILASIAVIVVHHLGYWEYRNRLLIPIAVGCGLMSAGYLVTASPIAPTLAHVLGHGAGILHGTELPPHPHAAAAPAPLPAGRHHLVG